ncbi:hypothetical protein MKEN_01365100 [Mycena kentingensis (nom. inval.)]|nr:hypothetical protein MKEN_01365100 [Mycena kentingensis (nom. inval.)]
MTKTPLTIAHEVLDILKDGGEEGRTKLESFLADDFMWRVYPEALQVPPKDKQAYLLHVDGVKKRFSGVKYGGEPIPEVQSDTAVAFRIKMELQIASTGEWHSMELMLTFVCTTNGQVQSLTEFVDTEAAHKISAAAGRGPGDEA